MRMNIKIARHRITYKPRWRISIILYVCVIWHCLLACILWSRTNKDLKTDQLLAVTKASPDKKPILPRRQETTNKRAIDVKQNEIIYSKAFGNEQFGAGDHQANLAKISQSLSLKKERSSSSRRANKRLNILYFTMDSLDAYVRQWKQGGPGGEIVVGHALQEAIRTLGHNLTIATSDEEFNKICVNETSGEAFDLFFFDRFTLYDKSWSLRPCLYNRHPDVLILDFFGASKFPINKLENGLPENILTAVERNCPPNTFLGIYLSNNETMESPEKVFHKSDFGIFWGKQERPKYIPEENVLKIAMKYFPLKASRAITVPYDDGTNRSTTSVGIVSREEYVNLMKQARFFLGSGEPLDGPSALEAIAQGCLLIIPKFQIRKLIMTGVYAETQHDYALKITPPERICTYDLHSDGSVHGLEACMGRAKAWNSSTPYLNPNLTKEAHLQRVRNILARWQKEDEEI